MKKVLILNRRCIKNSQKGGAEIYTLNIAKALMEAGFEVEWFASRENGLLKSEIIDNVKFIRRGNELTVHFYGFLYAFKKRKQAIIIDEFNGVGFFGFLFRKSILLIHQLYDGFWQAEFGVFGRLFEWMEIRLLNLYKKHSVVTVSNSTKKDLLSLGFNDEKICVVKNGLEAKPTQTIKGKKNDRLTLIFLGRIKKTKNPKDAIISFLKVKKIIEDAILYVVGDGPDLDKLKKKFSGEGIEFTGFVDNDKKYNLLSKSHFLLVPSIREGWGQVVIQANTVGTPAIGYDVPGLKDSIINGKTGYLVENPDEMAKKVLYIYKNDKIYSNLRKEAVLWAKNFSWDRMRKEFIECMRNKGMMARKH